MWKWNNLPLSIIACKCMEKYNSPTGYNHASSRECVKPMVCSWQLHFAYACLIYYVVHSKAGIVQCVNFRILYTETYWPQGIQWFTRCYAIFQHLMCSNSIIHWKCSRKFRLLLDLLTCFSNSLQSFIRGNFNYSFLVVVWLFFLPEESFSYFHPAKLNRLSIYVHTVILCAV